MDKIHLNKNQFSDLINLRNNVFYPLKNFVSKEEFIQIINNKRYENQFFPLPITFGVTKEIYLRFQEKKSFDLYYKNKYLINIYNVNFYNLDKKKISKKIYGINYLKHPYYKKFINENYKFMHFDFQKQNKINLRHKYFLSPSLFKKTLKVKKILKLSSFHTRNVPHKAHQWIHNFLLKKSDMLLIQPLIGQYKKGEYKDSIIIKTNKIISKTYKKKVRVIPFFSYPRYGGAKEAALHAIVRKNYGCSTFWVGRDHAGIGKFFSKYESQDFSKKNERKIGLKIVSEKEPYYCKKHLRVLNNCKCKKNYKILISGTKIRELILKKKKINNILMNPEVSKLLNINSIIK